MNSDAENPEAPKWRGWPILQRAQLIGAISGVLLTGGAYVIYLLNPPESMLAPSFSVLLLSGFPATLIISKISGHPQDLLINGIPEFLAIAFLVNVILGFLFGTLIGWLIQKLKTKNN